MYILTLMTGEQDCPTSHGLEFDHNPTTTDVPWTGQLWPPSPCADILTPRGDGIWRGGPWEVIGHKGGVLRTGFSVLVKDTPERCLTLVLDFSASRTMRITRVLYIHPPVCGVLLQPPEWTRQRGFTLWRSNSISKNLPWRHALKYETRFAQGHSLWHYFDTKILEQPTKHLPAWWYGRMVRSSASGGRRVRRAGLHRPRWSLVSLASR